MHTSQKGLDLIKSFEGLRLSAYRCPADIPTIGYGTTSGVKMGDTITKERAEELLRETARHVDDLASFADQTIMVNSNHHDHFTQWLEKAENANDLENAIVFHETKAVMLKAIADGDYCDPFRYWMDCLMERGDRLKWLRPDESFMRFGIDFSNHGHRGPNGARGSTQAFATVGAKVTHGHGHGARIIDGAHSVGTSSQMNMGYNAGSLSSWTHSHDITYAKELLPGFAHDYSRIYDNEFAGTSTAVVILTAIHK